MDFTTKTAMGSAIKALCEAEKKEYRTAIRYARKFNRLNRQYGRAVGKPSQLTLKNSDKMSKLINDIISMDRTDFKEVIRCAKHYRRAEELRQKALRFQNALDKDYGIRSNANTKGLEYELTN